MDITELNFLSDFDSQIFPISSLSKVPKIYSFALILAILAAFSGLIARTKYLILKICRIRILSSSTIDSIKLLNSDDFDYEYDDDVDDGVDDDVDTCSSVSSDEEYEERERESSSDEADYSTAGGIGRRFSWSDFSAGKSVVRLWDNLTAGFDNEEEQTDNVVSVWSEKTDNNGVLLGLYDNRVRSRLPDIGTEWPSLRRRSAAGVERVFVTGNAIDGMIVGDLRNVNSLLDGRLRSDNGTW